MMHGEWDLHHPAWRYVGMRIHAPLSPTEIGIVGQSARGIHTAVAAQAALAMGLPESHRWPPKGRPYYNALLGEAPLILMNARAAVSN